MSKPSEAERIYIGLSIQAQFGVSILGYDHATLKARLADLLHTLFLVDSSTLIPFIARSSLGHKSALLLINHIKSLDSVVATTVLLAGEVAEHARYALKKLDSTKGLLGPETMKAAMGKAGERSNAFLEGFLEEVAYGKVSDFYDYLGKACHSPRGICRDEDIQKAIQKEGILCYNLDDWEGFTKELWHDRDVLQENIAELRHEKNTFKHYRQVKAEAEALIIIKNIRDGVFKINDRNLVNAYFISHTRIIDEVAGGGLAVTMRPEAALQWLTTLRICTLEELSLLTNSLFWELNERDLTIIDRNLLQVTFSPLIQASKDKLNEELDKHRALISQQYGEEATKAFDEVDSLDLPIILESYYAQKVEYLAQRLKEQQKIAKKAQAQAKLTDKERQELETFRRDKKYRKKKALSQKRAADSRKKKKKT